MSTTKRYLDYEGLQTFWSLAKTYINKKTESTIETKLVYCVTDGEGNIKYRYNEAHGTVEHEVTYYERTGSGTTDDPYVYTEVFLTPGDSVEGYYVQGAPYTTIEPTEDELNHPYIDPETGEQGVQEVVVLDPETRETIERLLEEGRISEDEIMDLWS